jgi:Flp pilus assembly protein TadG
MRTNLTSRKARGGQAIVLFTLMVSTVLIPIVGLAIDGGRGYLVRLKLSSAVDGGALAAARLIGTGSSQTAQLNNAKSTASQFVTANFPAGFFGANLSGSPNVCIDPGTDTSDPCGVGNGNGVSTYKVRTVAVNATAQMPTMFMGLLGMPTVTVSSSGIASRRDVRVMVVVDRSSSMGSYFGSITDTTKINYMIWKFVNGFSGAGELGGRDEVGLVVFGGSAIIAVPPRDITKDYTDYTQFTPPNNNFKTTGNIQTLIGDIKSGSNTGTAEALYLAYMTLRADAATNTDLASKLNVIVLFTDGLPNGLTVFANDPDTNVTQNIMSSTCSDRSTPSYSNSPLASYVASNHNMIGWFAQWAGYSYTDNTGPHGLFPSMMSYAFSPKSTTPTTGWTGKGDDIDAYLTNAGADNNNYPNWTSTSGATVKQIPQMVGCTGDPITSTLATIPDRDLFGNYTNLDAGKVPAVSSVTPSTPPTGSTGHLYQKGDLWNNTSQCNKTNYDATQAQNACQIGLASWNATAHQAWKIWNQVIWDKTTKTNKLDPGPNMSQPVIFTIGFNHNPSDPPDMTLLQIVANDPAAPVSFSSRIHGTAYLATDANTVDMAFQQIASEILRLAR